MIPTDFAQEDMDIDTDIDDPDPQFTDKARTRTEGDIENRKLKGRNLLWDEDEEDMELDEVRSSLYQNMKVNYGNDRYNIREMNRTHVVLENIRGITVVLELDDIRGVTSDNTIITEIDEENLGGTLVRMIRAMRGMG
jgi:hypothetical protein